MLAVTFLAIIFCSTNEPCIPMIVYNTQEENIKLQCPRDINLWRIRLVPRIVSLTLPGELEKLQKMNKYSGIATGMLNKLENPTALKTSSDAVEKESNICFQYIRNCHNILTSDAKQTIASNKCQDPRETIRQATKLWRVIDRTVAWKLVLYLKTWVAKLHVANCIGARKSCTL